MHDYQKNFYFHFKAIFTQINFIVHCQGPNAKVRPKSITIGIHYLHNVGNSFKTLFITLRMIEDVFVEAEKKRFW